MKIHRKYTTPRVWQLSWRGDGGCRRRPTDSGALGGLVYETARRWIVRRAGWLVALALVVGCSLALRLFGYAAHLPFVVVKYGGSLLWAVMVYLLLATIVPTGRPPRLALVAMAIAVAVELFRLFHAPWLDAFRLTTAGALLLGRIFSPWNIVAYGIGIATAYSSHAFLLARRRGGV